MANPATRRNLHFFPEDTGPRLSQAWQASRWRHELDSDLTTPMIRTRNQDFYINEPTLLSNGSLCLPTRWFTRGNKTFAEAWKMYELPPRDPESDSAWVIDGDRKFEICETELLVSFPVLVSTFVSRKILDPRRICGRPQMNH
jgi:hypothetical protein